MIADLARAAEGLVLVARVLLVGHILRPPAPPRGRGRSPVYPDRSFLKAPVMVAGQVASPW